MKTMKEFLTEHGVELPRGMLESKWFAENELPLFVTCGKCGEENVPLLQAYVDDGGNTYCEDCKEDIQPEEPEGETDRGHDEKKTGTDIENALNYIFEE